MSPHAALHDTAEGDAQLAQCCVIASLVSLMAAYWMITLCQAAAATGSEDAAEHHHRVSAGHDPRRHRQDRRLDAGAGHRANRLPGATAPTGQAFGSLRQPLRLRLPAAGHLAPCTPVQQRLSDRNRGDTPRVVGDLLLQPTLDTLRYGKLITASECGKLNVVAPAAQTIDELCEECSALIEHHEKIQLLSIVHGNLRKTLVDVENIAELPQEAAAAEDLLQDNSRLLEVRLWACLTENFGQKLELNGKKTLRRPPRRTCSRTTPGCWRWAQNPLNPEPAPRRHRPLNQTGRTRWQQQALQLPQQQRLPQLVCRRQLQRRHRPAGQPPSTGATGLYCQDDTLRSTRVVVAAAGLPVPRGAGGDGDAGAEHPGRHRGPQPAGAAQAQPVLRPGALPRFWRTALCKRTRTLINTCWRSWH